MVPTRIRHRALVFATAQGIFFSPDRGSMLALANLPFALIPTFVLPLIFLTHLLVFWRVLLGNQASVAR